jgi:hypothetical protein
MFPAADLFHTPVSDLFARSSELVSLFLSWKVDCVGCSMNRFCTLSDVCDAYQLTPDEVVNLVQRMLAT